MSITRLSPALLLLSACLSSSVSRDEVARVTSPSQRTDAVLIESNGGATTPFAYFIYLVPKGAPVPVRGEVARLIAATRNDQAWGVNLRWDGSAQLLIEYRDARDAQFLRDNVLVGTDSIRIALKDGVVDRSAPPGGMLYNIRNARR
jgi:hypothetical protein